MTDIRLTRRRALFTALFLTMLPLLEACAPATPAAPPAGSPGGWREFGGEWTATGNRQVLELGAGRRSSVGTFSGNLRLSGPGRPNVGFRAEAIVFSDSAAGMTGRAVWTDERGDKVFSELRGDATAKGALVKGSFVGGTGRYEGIAGEYGFRWEFVLESDDGTVQGKSSGLEGRFRAEPRTAAERGGSAS